MRVRILGCSGGIGLGLRTTSILVDNHILIDAGTGVGDLTVGELKGIRHVFLTHSHMDHIAGLPLFLDSVFDDLMEQPITVYARAETISALREHVFNWVLWPDFETLPSPEQPMLRFQVLQPGERVALDCCTLRAVDVHHSVPSLGYCIEHGGGVFAFSGDTTTNASLWAILNAYENVQTLVMEVSFPDSQAALADKTGHYCPSTLSRDLEKLVHTPEIWVTAMKPGSEDEIFAEVLNTMPDRRIKRLRRGDVFDL
ncbi:MAG: 3',5'-cyclic-nucleotide phosphodiesterase [Pseudomonadota bacterium]